AGMTARADILSGETVLSVQTVLPVQAPYHGGDLQRAIAQYGGDADEWLDLSTGISPFSWPVRQALASMPPACWQALPDSQLMDDARVVFARYYSRQFKSTQFNSAQVSQTVAADHPDVSAVDPGQLVLASGSQALIQQLPGFYARQVFKRPLTSLTVWCLAGSYGEHSYQWRQQGAQVVEKTWSEWQRDYARLQQGERLDLPDVCILVNPDNPSARLWQSEQLQCWQQALEQQHGWLIIDAAFADIHHQPLLTLSDNTLVLASVGKFFGLAGLRVGCAILTSSIAAQLQQQLGPWPVAGPSLWLATQALADSQWQQHNRQQLARLRQLILSQCPGLPVLGYTDLFITLEHDQVEHFQRYLAQHKIWSRCFVQQKRLRIGMPNTRDVAALITALQAMIVTMEL
ncbi:MAG: aminotransferase class I/II-fold pyridoxal phosphate-dependent enzyme, partial [Pseudomonadota bacterium]